MQLINGAQCINITFSFLLFGVALCADMFGTVIVPLTCMYPSIESILQYSFPYFYEKKKIHSLSQIFNISVQLNSSLFFICYILINN